jgi:hypothetical protein
MGSKSMAISSISSNAISTSQSIVKVGTSNAQTGSAQKSGSSSASGDTVKISDEARSRLESAQAGGSTNTAQSDTAKASAGGGTPPVAAKEGASGAASSGSASSTSTSSEDEITKLEKEIQALQQEITALAAKALTDETAKSELAAKQAEMMGLTAELTQLRTRQA